MLLTNIIGLLFYLALFALVVWIAIVPWSILQELKRQGNERTEEARRLESLLRIATDHVRDRSEAEGT